MASGNSSSGGEEEYSTTSLQSSTGDRRKNSSRPLRIPSVNDVIMKEEEQWTVFSGSQNLSTALNDPSNRELDLFTRTWGSSFVPTAPLPFTNFPSIEVTDFLRYLKETAAGRKLHRNIVRQLKQGEESCRSPISPVNFLPLHAQLQQDGRSYDIACVPRIFMQRDFSLDDPPTFQQVLPLSQLMPKKRHALRNGNSPSSNTSSSAVKVDGHQFKGGLGPVEADRHQSKGGQGPLEADRHQSLKLLHEKLTHYLDIIEVHLAYEISQRSDVFFSTLSSQQELQSHIMQVRQEVMELRHKLREVSCTSVQGSLQLYNKCRRYRRHKDIYEKLKQISTVQQTQPTIQLLLRSSDFVGALDLITTTQEVLQHELHGVHALRHLGSQLVELEGAIEKMMEADLVEFAMEDIRYRLEICRNESTTTTVEVNESEERLGLVVMGLLRQGKFHFLAALRENILIYLKAKVKGILTAYLQEDVLGEEPPSLADYMRGMAYEAWMAMLNEVFDRMLQCQNAVQGTMKVIASMCKQASGGQTSTPEISNFQPSSLPVTPVTPPLASPDAVNVPSYQGNYGLECFEANSMAQEADDRLAQLLMDEELSDARLGLNGDKEVELTTGLYSETDVRSEVRERGLKLTEMSTSEESTCDPGETDRLEEANTIASYEKQTSSAIISAVDSNRLSLECNDIVSASCHLIHARCAKILRIRVNAGLLEDLMPTDFIALADRIEKFVRQSAAITGIQCPNLRSALQSQAKTFLDRFHDNNRKKLSLLLDGERWKQAEVPMEIQAFIHELEVGILPSSSKNEADITPGLSSSSLPPNKFLVIHGTNFVVVGTVLLLVRVLLQYCRYADSIPMLINEVMTKLIDIIKYFNTRTCELVLGAGAVDAVGLKAITARHLAIMMRCLQAISLLVPDLRTHFEARLEKQQHVLLRQFDSVTVDFSRHCDQIHSKLLSMMDDIIQKNLARWEVNTKQPIPSPCFRSITRQLVKLHENLVDIMPPHQLEVLFVKIEMKFRSRLKEQLIRLGITNNGSTKHGIVNSELHHCEGALSSLDNISAFGSSLFDVWTSAVDSHN